MDDDSGESTGVDEVAGVGRDESELEWLLVGPRLSERSRKLIPENQKIQKYQTIAHKRMDLDIGCRAKTNHSRMQNDTVNHSHDTRPLKL